MDTIVIILATILKIITVYTAIIGICFILPRKKKPIREPKTRFAILIAARNEEKVIGTLIESMLGQDYPRELFDIIVIPNNCTDNTEEAALDAGATVLRCTVPVRSKGDVLHFALEKLMGQYDAYCIFDADNTAQPNFLVRMNDVVLAGGKVAKSRICALNPYDNWVSGCYDLHLQSLNFLHSRGRASFPLSAKLNGTGFMVTDDLMRQLGGWNTYTLAEDLEFAAQCAELGVMIHYVPETANYDEEPTSFKTSLIQRRRWSSGIQNVAKMFIGRMLAKRPLWLRYDLAAHMSLIYVQILSIIPVVYGFVTMNPEKVITAILTAVLSFWLVITGMALFLTIISKRSITKMWKAILMYPIFIASWYPIHISALFVKPKTWKPIEHGKIKLKSKKKTISIHSI